MELVQLVASCCGQSVSQFDSIKGNATAATAECSLEIAASKEEEREREENGGLIRCDPVTTTIRTGK